MGLISIHFRQKIPQLFIIHQQSGFNIHSSLRACCKVCTLQQALLRILLFFVDKITKSHYNE